MAIAYWPASEFPPSWTSIRIRDWVETFDAEEVMKSCKRILKEKIPVSLKSMHIEFLNRTLCSRNKLFKFGLVESPNCSICHEIATTEHCLYECSFPRFCTTKIATFLDENPSNKKVLWKYLESTLIPKQKHLKST